ncbi:MAG: beta-glucosidase [Bryobacteraceae bacterium]
MKNHCDFLSFFMGGFECSTHRLASGKRLDLLSATKHDMYAKMDYQRLLEFGIRSARDGIRWHLIERSPYRYDFSSVLPMVRAARQTGVQILWDLFHYGWPDDLDLFHPEFVRRFRSLARSFACLLRDESGPVQYLSPVNEISFFAWGAGEVGCLNPFATGRGHELKAQLVRASIEAIEAIRDVLPAARFIQVDPVIHIVLDQFATEEEKRAARLHCRAQYEAWDLLAGHGAPELGGHHKYLDIVGVNYYVHNQWTYNGPPISSTHPGYRPLREMLAEVYHRYRRPLFIAETGIEDDLRPEWLKFIADEVIAAMGMGIPVEGICLYPIVNHPGWADDRHCKNGLWDYCDDSGGREIYAPLAAEIERQAVRIDEARNHYASKTVLELRTDAREPVSKLRSN